jgi:hypothetical protein
MWERALGEDDKAMALAVIVVFAAAAGLAAAELAHLPACTTKLSPTAQGKNVHVAVGDGVAVKDTST